MTEMIEWFDALMVDLTPWLCVGVILTVLALYSFAEFADEQARKKRLAGQKPSTSQRARAKAKTKKKKTS